MEVKNKEQKTNKKEKLLYIILVFIIGALIGWIYEEIFFLFQDHQLTNRGFLYGPYLPVYGWGAIFLALCLSKFKKHPVLVFLGACLITGVLEYFTGLGMDAIWHKKWWDYTGLFMNIQGYVCLRSVVSFGIGSLALIYVLNPIIEKFIKNKEKLATIICLSFLIVYVIDNIITFSIRY